MADTVDESVQLTDSITETMSVTPLGEDLFRLEDMPISALFEEMDIAQGDVIKATRDPDGSLRFSMVVVRSSLRMRGFLVGRDILESDAFRVFTDTLTAAGGSSERVFGGVLVVHVPDGSPFNPAVELDTVVERVLQDGKADSS